MNRSESNEYKRFIENLLVLKTDSLLESKHAQMRF